MRSIVEGNLARASLVASQAHAAAAAEYVVAANLRKAAAAAAGSDPSSHEYSRYRAAHSDMVAAERRLCDAEQAALAAARKNAVDYWMRRNEAASG